MPSAVMACCTRASPPKLEISTSMPCFLKMPVRAPTSAGANEKASRPALPMRTVSAEATGDGEQPCTAPPQAAVEANRHRRLPVDLFSPLCGLARRGFGLARLPPILAVLAASRVALSSSDMLPRSTTP